MTFVVQKTEIPGPKSRALMERRNQAIPRGPYNVAPIFIDHGEGSRVTDVDGNVYLDFAGGLGCLNVGHAPPALVSKIQEQASKFLHTCFHVMPYEPYVALAERLNELAPGDHPKKTVLLNSGAEGVENAVKIARAVTGRPGVLVFEDSFHGRTHLGMSLTSKVVPYKAGFGPFMAEVYRVPYAYCYRCTYNLEPTTCGTFCAETALEDYFKRYVDPNSIACLVVEPVQGEGGFIVPPKDFFAKLRKICDKYRIVLVADEVQAGMGRTGVLFASEAVGLQPDLIVTAKSIAGGLPLSAVTGRAEMMDAPGVGGLGGTYGGNPLSCAAALEVLRLLQEGLTQRAKHIETRFRERAAQMAAKLPIIGDVRGLGAMMALELVSDRKTRKPAKEATARFTKAAYQKGLLTITAGTHGNVIRTLMPLVITDEEMEEGFTLMEAALVQASSDGC